MLASRSASLSISAGAGGDAQEAPVPDSSEACCQAPAERSTSGLGPCRPPLADRRKVRGASHVAALRESRALGPQRDKCGDGHDDEDGPDNLEDSVIEPHHWHARR